MSLFLTDFSFPTPTPAKSGIESRVSHMQGKSYTTEPLFFLLESITLAENSNTPLYPSITSARLQLPVTKSHCSRLTCYWGCHGDDHRKFGRQSLDANTVVSTWAQVQTHLGILAVCSGIKDNFMGKFFLIPSLTMYVELKYRKFTKWLTGVKSSQWLNT